MDDASLGGSIDDILQDLRKIQQFGEKRGLALNAGKCDLFSTKDGGVSVEVLAEVKKYLPTVRNVQKECLTLLGSPVFPEGIAAVITEKTNQAKLLTSRLAILPSHQALYLLSNCPSLPRLLHILRSSPAYQFPNALVQFDDVIFDSLEKVTNVELS